MQASELRREQDSRFLVSTSSVDLNPDLGRSPQRRALDNMSLYAEYLREKTDDEIIETVEGFATYRFLPGYACYIIDIY